MPVLQAEAAETTSGKGSGSGAALHDGSIEILYAVDNKQTLISGAEFSCVLAAAGRTDGRYVWCSPYAGQDATAGIEPDELTSEILKTLPGELLQLTEAQNGNGNKGTGQADPAAAAATGADGRCTLETTEVGLYLVWQSGAAGMAEQYETAAPMLVFVPSADQEGQAVYAVGVEPKTSRKPDKPEQPGEPEQPDEPEKPDQPGEPHWKGAVILTKVDAEDSSILLAGAEFDLCQTDGNGKNVRIGHYTTDRNGQITVSGLAYGDYCFTETKAPDGYRLNNVSITFTLNSTTSPGVNYPWKITFENTRKAGLSAAPAEPGSPIQQLVRFLPTGDSSNIVMWGMTAAASAAALIFLIVIKRRRKRAGFADAKSSQSGTGAGKRGIGDQHAEE